MINYLLTNFGAQLIDKTTLPVVETSSALANGLRIFFGILGAIAFLMMVIAGFKFVLSSGNPEQVNQARNTIIYAAVGLVVAASASAIVTLVLSKA